MKRLLAMSVLHAGDRSSELDFDTVTGVSLGCRKSRVRRPAFETTTYRAVFVILVLQDNGASLDAALDLETARQRLVVVRQRGLTRIVRDTNNHLCNYDCASLDAALDLQAASNGLVVIRCNPSSLDVRFDFHTSPSPFRCRR